MVHAFDYLANPQNHAIERGVCAVFGDEPLLVQLALAAIRKSLATADEDELPFRTFDGESAQWRDVSDELCTASLFGDGPRLVIVEDAEKFVTAHRDKLEDYAAKPAQGLLVLMLDSLPGNTRLAKEVEKSGLAIECRVPASYRGKTKVVDEKRVVKWLVERAKGEHGAKLETSAAEEMLDLVGPQLGLLDTELAKLVLYVEAGQPVTAELVRDIVGGWRTKSVWQLMDAAAEGNAGEALAALDKLLAMGEAPQALFGQIAWSLRRFADAVSILEHAEKSGRRLTLAHALEAAGVRTFQLKAAEQQLRQIGRQRASQLHDWLLEADLALKGTHSHADRGRLVLEELMVRVSSSSRDIPVSTYAM
jgi:DNA polymerase-3 subunit delta